MAVRWIGGLEKGAAYYLQNYVFWTKMALFATIFVLELESGLTPWTCGP